MAALIASVDIVFAVGSAPKSIMFTVSAIEVFIIIAVRINVRAAIFFIFIVPYTA